MAEHRKHRRIPGPRGDMEGYLMMLLLDQPLTVEQMAEKTQFLLVSDRQSEVSSRARLTRAISSLCSKGLTA